MSELVAVEIVRTLCGSVGLVAAVVAESREAAEAAADLVMVDYDPLPALATVDAALAPGAAAISTIAADNICFVASLLCFPVQKRSG